MANNKIAVAMAQFIQTMGARESAGKTDGQLLTKFLGQRDEAAFAALVRRHGAMVLGVCRRILGNAADAEDAFQATFLVLLRKAKSLKRRAVVGDWLHGVARRTALKARSAAAHRWTKEQAMARPVAQGEQTRDDWLPLLDEELSGLPEKYRLPIVLCDLEGRTRQEVALHLGWAEGTVAGRLARARTMLAKRLNRRGVILPAAALTILSQKTAMALVPPSLVSSTVKAVGLVAAGQAAGVISAKVATLTGEVMKIMLFNKLKNLALVLMVCAFGGVSWIAYGSFGKEPGGSGQRVRSIVLPGIEQVEDKKEPEKKEAEEKKQDIKEAIPSPKKDDRERLTSRELVATMREVIDMKDFSAQMTLREFVGLLYEKLKSSNLEFPVLVDSEAFREDNPKDDVYETPVRYPHYPKSMTTAMAIEIAISQIPKCKAAVLVRDGFVVITTQKRASLSYLLQEQVFSQFQNQPLDRVVRDLADLNGISITLDPRVEEKAKTSISATFFNDVTLGGALRIVTDIAGLKVVDMKSGLYVTTPANAKELEKELRELKK